MIEFINGEPPYIRLGPYKALFNIATKDPPRIQSGSNEMKDFVHSCL